MSLLRHVVIWGVLALIALVVVKTSLARMWQTSNYERALDLRPRHSEALIAQNVSWLSEPSLETSKAVQENAEIILKRAPLNDDALLHLALIQDRVSPKLNVGDLLLLAKDRKARNRDTLRQLVQYYIRLGDVKNTISMVDLLFRLDPENLDTYRRALYGFYTLESGREPINQALKSGPSWGYHILKLKLQDVSKTDILSLKQPISDYLSATSPSYATRDLQRDYLMRLMGMDYDDTAYDIWADWTSAETRQAGDAKPNLIFNPTIRNLDAVFPFNWYYYNDETTLIEPEPQGGVFISSALKEPRLILRQYVKLDPDRPLQLITRSNLNTQSSDQSRFQWKILCAKDRRHIVTASIFDNTPDKARGQHTLSVPAPDCHYLDLQLWGKPALYKNRITLFLEDVSLITREATL